MPTEPAPTTLAEVVRRAVEICEPDGLSGDMERFMLEFEDRDEPISAVEDLPGEMNTALERGAEGVIDPGLRMAAAIITYLGFRRDEICDDDVEIMRLAARAEWQGHIPDDVARWLGEQESRSRTTGSAGPWQATRTSAPPGAPTTARKAQRRVRASSRR